MTLINLQSDTRLFFIDKLLDVPSIIITVSKDFIKKKIIVSWALPSFYIFTFIDPYKMYQFYLLNQRHFKDKKEEDITKKFDKFSTIRYYIRGVTMRAILSNPAD